MNGTPDSIVLASSNPGKLRELRALLPAGFILVSQSELGVTPAVEDGTSFRDNALIKARHAARCTGHAAIADDSGLECDALSGRPGIHSARYAGPHAADPDNVDKLLTELASVPGPERSARFRCVIVYVRNADDPAPIVCDGVWEGHIRREPSGHDGFGYDPVFQVPNHDCSAADLDPNLKNALSHRGQALAKLIAALAPPVAAGGGTPP